MGIIDLPSAIQPNVTESENTQFVIQLRSIQNQINMMRARISANFKLKQRYFEKILYRPYSRVYPYDYIFNRQNERKTNTPFKTRIPIKKINKMRKTSLIRDNDNRNITKMNLNF